MCASKKCCREDICKLAFCAWISKNTNIVNFSIIPECIKGCVFYEAKCSSIGVKCLKISLFLNRIKVSYGTGLSSHWKSLTLVFPLSLR